MPHLAGGLYGYEPADSGSVLFDEMVESLIQIDEVEPNYVLREVMVMDQELGTVECLKESLEDVEEKFGEQNFRVLSEMRILGKIKVAILDFGRVCFFLTKFGAKSDFRV